LGDETGWMKIPTYLSGKEMEIMKMKKKKSSSTPKRG
jgi:hypothetical protein